LPLVVVILIIHGVFNLVCARDLNGGIRSK
jgi:hypothetical protein